MAIGDYSNFGGYVNNELKPNKEADQPFGKQVSAAAHEKNAIRKTERTESATEITEAPADVQQDQAIIESNFEAGSSNAASEPLVLTLNAVIANINEQLPPEMGTIEESVEAGIDVSPEATADRIVSLTTAMFSAYQAANPDLEGAALVDQFVDVIGGGIEQGFNEARTILDGLNVLEGDIASNIDLTFELVQQGLEKFRVDNGGTPSSTDPSEGEAVEATVDTSTPTDPASGDTILTSSEA
ncbi:DUF5610 domain-containing protein [uncultured Neptuniibacter sp.]|uniref:DUF5610 domain-containing protein n=1 Tax=uncultured Neptuniibacter sp. TaxID=502143 RepID=UPI002601F11C|nr:DUF5610 domain-containing protein [uncultured Neptuniibacter sp.]